MNESDTSTSETEQNDRINIYWAACEKCGYTTAVHGRANCPDCDQKLAPYELAGTVPDDEMRSGDSGGDLDA